ILQMLVLNLVPILIYPTDDIIKAFFYIYAGTPTQLCAGASRVDYICGILAGTLINNDSGLFILASKLFANLPDHIAHSYAAIGREMIGLTQYSMLKDRQFSARNVPNVNVGFDGRASAVQFDFTSELQVDDRARNYLKQLLPSAINVCRAHSHERKSELFEVCVQEHIGGSLRGSIRRAWIKRRVFIYIADARAVCLWR